MSEEGRIVHHHHDSGHHHHPSDDSDQFGPPPPPPVVPQYGTFEGIPHSPASPAMGFPQPMPPRGAMDQYYARGYQAVPGYMVAEGRPVPAVRDSESRLPCCGLGFGWFLFIIGFFLAGFPWYLGALLLICSRNVDRREKPGYVGCTIAGVLAIIAIIFGVTRANDD